MPWYLIIVRFDKATIKSIKGVFKKVFNKEEAYSKRKISTFATDLLKNRHIDYLKQLSLMNKAFSHEFYRIKSVKDKYYSAFYDIYSQSFPIHEQRNVEQQVMAFDSEDYHLVCLLEQDEILSFIAYWDFNSYVYIEHLAVNHKMRGKNIGSETLSLFAHVIQKTIILEIDPLIDEIALKRYRFYEKLGYISNPYLHHHPAYNREYTPHKLVVLSYPNKLDQTQYNKFNNDLRDIVMNLGD